MKKLLLIVAIALFGYTGQAQNFNVGANVGLPLGNASDVASFFIGAEANYLFEVSDEFKVGPSVGYHHFFGKSINVDELIRDAGFDPATVPASVRTQIQAEADNTDTSTSYIPVAAAARYQVSDEFVLGADVGLGFGASNFSGSGFYFRPLVGYNISEKMTVQASYNSVSVTGGSFSSFSAGLMFSLE